MSRNASENLIRGHLEGDSRRDRAVTQFMNLMMAIGRYLNYQDDYPGVTGHSNPKLVRRLTAAGRLEQKYGIK